MPNTPYQIVKYHREVGYWVLCPKRIVRLSDAQMRELIRLKKGGISTLEALGIVQGHRL